MKLRRAARRRGLRPAERYLTLGADEARRAGSGAIRIEHVLRALDRHHEADERAAHRPPPPAGPPAQIDRDALGSIGIDFDAVRAQLERTFGPGALERTRTGCLGIAPDLKIALARAVELAGDGPVADAHVLRAILGDDEAGRSRTRAT
ncbi:MAG TPA: Clp protease N-terminal domain-containing protein [Gaiellaceae bacterium]|nr:Clp protease N-terminal domain-containing protein [Gaiellaceae bacterium]